MVVFNITIAGNKMEKMFHVSGYNYVSLRYMVYALEGITHEQNEAMPVEQQKVVWDIAKKWAIFRITDRFTREIKVIEFSIAGLESNTLPTQREVRVNGKPAGFINFVFHDNLNMIGVRDLSRLAGLEGYLQWYNQGDSQYVDLRVEDPLYGYNSLAAAVNAIIERQGGIPTALTGDFYQVLYGTANAGGKNNRYSGYMFSVLDALQWLIQTGGDISFALQIRDTIYATNQVQTAIEGQWEIIQQFIRGRDWLDQCGYKVKMPRFFVGTPEENVEVTKYGTGGMLAIFEGLANKLKSAGFTSIGTDEVLAGMYFGSETAKSELNLPEIRAYLVKQGAKLLWIPYFFTRDTLNRIKEISAYFDKVILQPGIFYNMGSYYEKTITDKERLEDSEKWADILALISNDKKSRFGIELEFDLGLLTGRGDRAPGMSPADKQNMFSEYINKTIPCFGTAPIGIYSGGPNEQGYNNICRNSNLHNDQNHTPAVLNFGTGSNYSDLYNGNLIYEINSILFSNRPNKSKQQELASLNSSI
ncbi:MAG: DUF4855 domain-containing protein [Clostridiales bacterium]|nr:DUF4855 domain-containing protein [Clostridiales bacterium]